MRFAGLSRFPLLTFSLACLMVYFIVTRRNKDRKANIAVYYSAGIASLLITIQRLNNIYFILPKTILVLIDIAIFSCFSLMMILIFYSAFTNKENPSSKKSAYIGLSLIILTVIIAMVFIILIKRGFL